MANQIDLVTKYLPLLDEVYATSAKTSELEASPELVRQTDEANVVKIAKLALQGLGDYSKSTGAPAGDISLGWETWTFQNDRGRKFNLDKMDDMESLGLAFLNLAGTFLRTKVVPEKDAYTFAKIASTTGVEGAEGALTSSNTKQALETALTTLEENEVDAESLMIYMNPTVRGALEAQIGRDLASGVNSYGQKINYFNDIPIMTVPSNRFYSAIDLKDGTTTGEEAGGFAKATTGGVSLNFIVMDKNAAKSITKRAVTKIITPELNQFIDGWTFHFRFYHDTFVYDNKTKGIYVHKASA